MCVVPNVWAAVCVGTYVTAHRTYMISSSTCRYVTAHRTYMISSSTCRYVTAHRTYMISSSTCRYVTAHRTYMISSSTCRYVTAHRTYMISSGAFYIFNTFSLHNWMMFNFHSYNHYTPSYPKSKIVVYYETGCKTCAKLKIHNSIQFCILLILQLI
jgi:hypothetical protein